jgi:hypothetical protein
VQIRSTEAVDGTRLDSIRPQPVAPHTIDARPAARVTLSAELRARLESDGLPASADLPVPLGTLLLRVPLATDSAHLDERRMMLARALATLGLPVSALDPRSVSDGEALLRARLGGGTTDLGVWFASESAREDRLLLGMLYAAQRGRGELAAVDEVTRSLHALRSAERDAHGSSPGAPAKVDTPAPVHRADAAKVAALYRSIAPPRPASSLVPPPALPSVPPAGAATQALRLVEALGISGLLARAQVHASLARRLEREPGRAARPALPSDDETEQSAQQQSRWRRLFARNRRRSKRRRR